MTAHGTSRRLATILAADVVGYSRLMATDEEATVRTLKAHREIIDRLIARHDGRIFNTAGDSVLAEFGSAVEAVRCAITIQDELRVRNAELDASRRMLFRIGVNIGDVILDGDNLLGDGVNVAARLESIAPPGGVCISGGTFEQVKNKLSVGFEDLGPQSVKNIPEPVAAFRITGAPVSVRTTERATVSAGNRRGLAKAGLAAAVAAAAVAGFVGWQNAQRDVGPHPEARAPTAPTAPPPITTPETPSPAEHPDAAPTVASVPPPEETAAREASAPSSAPPAPGPRPVTPGPVSTADLSADDIAALLTGRTLRGTREKDGQPFTIVLHEPGRATYSFPRGGAGTGTTFRATGTWRTEDGRFCMRFRGFNQGQEACPAFTRDGTTVTAHRPNGERLDWTVERDAPRAPPPRQATSTDDLLAPAIAALVEGGTIEGTVPHNGRPLTITLAADGRAAVTVVRPNNSTFQETGKWWSEDYRFCMQFAKFGQGEERCPRILLGSERLAMTRGDGGPLPWELVPAPR